MGKTSLIEQVLKDIGTSKRQVVALTIDLMVVHDADELEKRIRKGVAQLGVELLPKNQKTTAKLTKAFSGFNPQFSVGALGINLTLAKPSSPVQGIAELLMGLDCAAGLYKRRVVIVLDEFQQLTTLKDAAVKRATEGAIRHAVERSKHITYLFAGSQKHLLASMFEDEDRPLYRLCRKMTLGRIDAEAYRAFLHSAGKARWRRVLSDEIINQILVITTRHPYYVNALCARLWDSCSSPSAKTIEAKWNALIAENRSVVAGKVLRLSATQRAMLKAIAHTENGVEHPTSQAFLAQIRLAASTGNKAKDLLEQDDFIHQDEQDRWCLVDPVMTSYLRTL